MNMLDAIEAETARVRLTVAEYEYKRLNLQNDHIFYNCGCGDCRQKRAAETTYLKLRAQALGRDN